MTDRQPPHVREYIPEHQKKTTTDIQRDIAWMRLAHEYRDDLNRPRGLWLGWALLAVLIIPAIIIITLILL